MSKENDKSKVKNVFKAVGYEARIVLEIGAKYVREMLRSKVFLIIAVFLPIFFMIFMAIAFGGALSPVQTYNIYILNEDSGYIFNTVEYELGNMLVDTFENATYPQEGH